MSFDGSCWVGGCNNQPKVDSIIGIFSWEMARRAMVIEEDAFATFRPLDYRAKKETLPKFVVALGGCELTMSHKKTTKFTRGRWIRVRRGRSTGGECRGAVFDRSGGDQGGRGEKII